MPDTPPQAPPGANLPAALQPPASSVIEPPKNLLEFPKTGQRDINALHDLLSAAGIRPKVVEEAEDGTLRLWFENEAAKEAVKAQVNQIITAYVFQPRALAPDVKALIDQFKTDAAIPAPVRARLGAILEALRAGHR